MNFKVNVTFQGTASLELSADTTEAVRLAVLDMTVADLARAGHVDIISFKIAAREITRVASLRGTDDSGFDEDTSNRPRPSGWYRPK